ncbi:hypothetical protein L3Q82_021602 [Scortum barcoo]|uniref:Uncharacterized protein n=1 Tax=Scortum barcoo TaxID=214431 RepID=A0ACB8X4V3_9TELE|nr:hypothetical protein L3Q82_021602 [Scortum barcoo]
MAADGFQYLALYAFTKDQEEDLDLQPGDLLTVSKASLLAMENYQEGCVEQPERLGWLLGYNERTKQRGDFPGTYVEYVGPVKMVLPSSQPRSQRPLPAAPRPDSSQGAGGAAPGGAQPKMAMWARLPVGSPPRRKVHVGMAMQSGLGSKSWPGASTTQSLDQNSGNRDMECHLTGGEGA